jgi:hypothetical protein
MHELYIKYKLKGIYQGWSYFSQENYELIEKIEYFEKLRINKN